MWIFAGYFAIKHRVIRPIMMKLLVPVEAVSLTRKMSRSLFCRARAVPATVLAVAMEPSTNRLVPAESSATPVHQSSPVPPNLCSIWDEEEEAGPKTRAHGAQVRESTNKSRICLLWKDIRVRYSPRTSLWPKRH